MKKKVVIAGVVVAVIAVAAGISAMRRWRRKPLFRW